MGFRRHAAARARRLRAGAAGEPSAVIGVAFALVVGWFALAQVAFNRGLWLDVTFPTAAILLNVGCVAALRATIERRMRRNLARYHSPNIVDLLAERATRASRPRPERGDPVRRHRRLHRPRRGPEPGRHRAAAARLPRPRRARRAGAWRRARTLHGRRRAGDLRRAQPERHRRRRGARLRARLGRGHPLLEHRPRRRGQKPLDVSVGIHYGRW